MAHVNHIVNGIFEEMDLIASVTRQCTDTDNFCAGCDRIWNGFYTERRSGKSIRCSMMCCPADFNPSDTRCPYSKLWRALDECACALERLPILAGERKVNE